MFKEKIRIKCNNVHVGITTIFGVQQQQEQQKFKIIWDWEAHHRVRVHTHRQYKWIIILYDQEIFVLLEKRK